MMSSTRARAAASCLLVFVATQPAVAATSRPGATEPSREGPPSVSAPPVLAPTATSQDVVAESERKRTFRDDWSLSLEGVTHAPIDIGLQVGLELPGGLRLSGGLGWVPEAYMSLLTNAAANATGNSYARAILGQVRYAGRTFRVQAGLRPFRSLGLYAEAGYSRLTADASFSLADSGVQELEAIGGGYTANAVLDLWLFEIGYEGRLNDRFLIALAVGATGTLRARTTFSAVNGAPTHSLLGVAAEQTNSAIESYGVTPTLTLRLGFDLL
jgi:hypothetical protein